MNNFVESQLEEACLEWLEGIGYERIYGPDIAPGANFEERKTYSDVVLIERLRQSLLDINDNSSEDVIDEAIHRLLSFSHEDYLENNFNFHQFLINGIPVRERTDSGEYLTKNIQIVNWDNPGLNDFIAVNQFTVIERGVEKRPDIILFINGIPLVVIELKNAADENVDIDQAFNQIENYKGSIPSLFKYNCFNVISDGINAQVGTITSTQEWYTTWKTIDGITPVQNSIPQLEVVVRGLLNKSVFIDIIKNFLVFKDNGQSYSKILAGYHQYHAVNKAIDRTRIAITNRDDKRIGVIWHTQGAGKSFSMLFYVGKLVHSSEFNNPTIVIITDRNDLDEQLFQDFDDCKKMLSTIPENIQDRAHLRRCLSSKSSGGIVFTTIQKFMLEPSESEMPVLTDRNNIIVICDEAHRSQYGFSAEVLQNNDLTEAQIKYGYAKYLRDGLPNASYIGFTGTPIEMTDKNTVSVFGNYIDKYDMNRSVLDGTTLKIYYESRIANIELSDDQRPHIDEEYDEITENQEDIQRKNLKSKWSRLEAIVGTTERINIIAQDIVNHYEKRQLSQISGEGKAMIVCMSRRICIEMYKAIIKLRPEWHSDDNSKGKLKVIMTTKSSDPSEWSKYSGNKKYREYMAKRFKNDRDELKIVIVRDMWLTGFNVPSMNTLYIDKPMSGHNLMQAIARVNRVFKDKQGGLVVDYIGIAENLKLALAQYTDTDKKQINLNTDTVTDILIEKLILIDEILYGHDYNKFFIGTPSEKMQQIVETIDFILGLDKERKNDYMDNVTAAVKAYSLCSTTDVAMSNNEKIGFHKAIKAGIIKIIGENSSKKTTSQLDFELNQLVSKSVSSNGVIDVLNVIGVDKPDIAILSDEFLEEIGNLSHKNLAIELLNRLIKGNIKAYSRRNLSKAKKFSDLLEESIRRYQSRTIGTTKAILELLDIAKAMNESYHKGEQTGLTPEELAFYDALIANSTACGDITNDELKQMAIEIVQQIKSNITVDWSIRKNVQAKMRLAVKKVLKAHGYPKDKFDEATNLIMEQTHLMCENESQELKFKSF